MMRLHGVMPTSAERPFTGMTLDRAETERKHPDRVRQLACDPSRRAVLGGSDGVVISDGALLRTELLPIDGSEPILLGLDQGGGLFAIDLDALAPAKREQLLGGARLVALRDAGAAL